MAETHFDEWIARRYRVLWPELFEPPLLDAAVDFLAELARPGRALEFGIGTGRIALPLRLQGVPVHGIELAPAMVAELQRQAPASHIEVTLGNFATTKVDATFRVVYLLRNTITNLTTQDEHGRQSRRTGVWCDPHELCSPRATGHRWMRTRRVQFADSGAVHDHARAACSGSPKHDG